MKDGLYHKDVGFPKGLQILPVFSLIVSEHARRSATNLGVTLPQHFLPKVAEVIEVEVFRGQINKILARQPMDDKRDMCYPFLVSSKLIKTVWINIREDKHHTLDKSKFIVP